MEFRKNMEGVTALASFKKIEEWGKKKGGRGGRGEERGGEKRKRMTDTGRRKDNANGGCPMERQLLPYGHSQRTHSKP